MMKTRISAILIFSLIVAGLVLSSCGETFEKSRQPSSDWSRGINLGGPTKGSLGLWIDNQTEDISLIWSVTTDKGVQPRLVQFDTATEITLDTVIDVPTYVRAPRFIKTTDGLMYVFWSARASSSDRWKLYVCEIDQEGKVINGPALISNREEDVSRFEIGALNSNEIIAIWDSGSKGIIYSSIIKSGEEPSGSPIQVTSSGESPSIKVSDSGDIHVTWIDGRIIYYDQLTSEGEPSNHPILITDLDLSLSDSLSGPLLGITDEWVYIIWSVLSQAGLEAGSSRTEYVAFPYGDPKYAIPERLGILPVEEQPYQDYLGTLAIELLAPPVPSYYSSDNVYHPGLPQKQESELVIALAVNQQFRLDSSLQIFIVVFQNGKFIGYSQASKSDQVSDYPVVGIDSEGQIHIAWREGAGGKKVYYASTSPEQIDVINKFSAGDLSNLVLQGGIESFVSVALLPIIGFGWMIIGLSIIGIWKLINEHETIRDPKSLAVLIIGLIIYQAIKFISLPTITTYVPFSAWIDISPGLGRAFQYSVPILIILAAIFVANRVRKKYSESTAIYYVAFTITDAILTLAIYGVNLLGVY